MQISSGKGRGRQVIAVARTADLIVMMLDAVKGDIQRWSDPHDWTDQPLTDGSLENYWKESWSQWGFD